MTAIFLSSVLESDGNERPIRSRTRARLGKLWPMGAGRDHSPLHEWRQRHYQTRSAAAASPGSAKGPGVGFDRFRRLPK